MQVARRVNGRLTNKTIETVGGNGMRMKNISKMTFTKLEFVSLRISGEVERACRVLDDITSKPPTTAEWK